MESIDCDLCRETAPANFARDADESHSFVYKQPQNEEEEALFREAMEGCHVERISSDLNDNMNTNELDTNDRPAASTQAGPQLFIVAGASLGQMSIGRFVALALRARIDSNHRYFLDSSSICFCQIHPGIIHAGMKTIALPSPAST
jgi:ferredoxin